MSDIAYENCQCDGNYVCDACHEEMYLMMAEDNETALIERLEADDEDVPF